jgi:hypothetical protein
MAAVSGLSYLLGDPIRTSSPNFEMAKSLMSMHAWGWVFLAGLFAETVAIIVASNVPVAITFWVGGLIYLWWSVCFGIQAVQNPTASLVAWAPYMVVAIFHWRMAYGLWMRRSRARSIQRARGALVRAEKELER